MDENLFRERERRKSIFEPVDDFGEVGCGGCLEGGIGKRGEFEGNKMIN